MRGTAAQLQVGSAGSHFGGAGVGHGQYFPQHCTGGIGVGHGTYFPQPLGAAGARMVGPVTTIGAGGVSVGAAVGRFACVISPDPPHATHASSSPATASRFGISTSKKRRETPERVGPILGPMSYGGDACHPRGTLVSR